VESRLHASLAPVEAEMTGTRTSIADHMSNRLSRMSFGERLERRLVAADSSLSVGEFMLTRVGITAGFLLLGWLISGYLIGGLLLAVIGWILPGIWLGRKQGKRAKAFADQLPDMLTMLVGSLRAGYGLLYAITVIEKEMPEPMSTEFGRVVRETALGYTISDALDHLVQRVQNEDLELVVTAIHIQSEVGGSLADVLDTISRTIRDRIQLKGQIQAITSQQRMTGTLLSALPIVLGTVLFLMNGEYMMAMFVVGWPIMIPSTAFVMVILGNIVMRRVIQIDV
jgi:tight adherence protein B